MIKNKSGQFFMISGFLITLGLIFIYSIETENYYIISPSKSSLLSNIEYQVCKVATNSNGSFIDTRFSDIETNIENYCSDISISCDLVIDKSLSAPTNLSELNYSYYNFSISYQDGGFSLGEEFECN